MYINTRRHFLRASLLPCFVHPLWYFYPQLIHWFTALHEVSLKKLASKTVTPEYFHSTYRNFKCLIRCFHIKNNLSVVKFLKCVVLEYGPEVSSMDEKGIGTINSPQCCIHTCNKILRTHQMNRAHMKMFGSEYCQTHCAKWVWTLRCFPFVIGKLDLGKGNAHPVCAHWVALFNLFGAWCLEVCCRLKRLFSFCNYGLFTRKMLDVSPPSHRPTRKSYFWKQCYPF